MIKVLLLDERHDSAWDDYVSAHSDGTPFHLTRWRDAVARAFGHPSLFLGAFRKERLCGVLPLVHLKSRLFGNILSSVAFAAYGGILADDSEVFDALLAKARLAARLYQTDWLELKFLEEPPCRLPGQDDLYVTFVKEIFPDPQKNYAAIPRKQRRMIRVGQKAGLVARTGHSCLDDFYEIFAVNVRRLGTPVYSRRWFSELLGAFGENAEIMVVEYRGKVVSGVLSLYFRDTVYPYYAASLTEYRRYAPNDFQYWELMTRAAARGCKRFDFGRSKRDTGQFHFKRHWGFTPRPLHYRYILNRVSELPALNPLNPAYRRKIEAWKRLPLPVTKILGPQIVKYIP